MNRSQILTSAANKGALKNLARVLSSESPLALVGAGMSVAAGFPTWAGLLGFLDAKLTSLEGPYRDMLRLETDLLWRADEYRRMLPIPTFERAIRSIFGKSPKLRKDDPTAIFVKLPFKHIITTNYDDVIRRAHGLCGLPEPRMMTWNSDDVREFIFGLRDQRTQRCVLHLHGHHSDPASIILSENDYTERYVRSFGTMSKLFAIFSTERFVFAGFSLNDPDLMALLRQVNATMQSIEPRHFAIIPIDKTDREVIERNRLRTRYGVEPVFYRPSEHDHAGLVEILQKLNNPATTEPGPKSYKPLEDRDVTVPVRDEKVPFDPDDPEKGRWGGRSKASGREVTASVRALAVDWFEVTMSVRSTNKQKLLGDVIFHLHPTLIPKVRAVSPVDGVATLKVESYGAYTVGIETDDGKVHLEIDLSQIASAPMMFRLN